MVKNEFEWRKLSGSVKVSVWVCEGVRRKNVVYVGFVLQRSCSAILKPIVETGLRYSTRQHAIAQPN